MSGTKFSKKSYHVGLVVHLYFSSDLGPSLTTSAKRYSFFSNGER